MGYSSPNTMQQQQQQPLLAGADEEDGPEDIFANIDTHSNPPNEFDNDYTEPPYAEGYDDNSNYNLHSSPMADPQLRGQQHAQSNDEEQAVMDDIEVNGSSVVQRLQQREMEFAISKEYGEDDSFEDENGTHRTRGLGGWGGGGGGFCGKRNRVIGLVAICAVGALVAGVVVGTSNPPIKIIGSVISNRKICRKCFSPSKNNWTFLKQW